MCHLSMKFSDMSDQNLLYTFDRIREKHIPIKMLSQLDLENQGQDHHRKRSTKVKSNQVKLNVLSHRIGIFRYVITAEY